MKNIIIIAKHNLKLYLSDPAALIVFVFMPLILMGFFAPLNKASLILEGYTQASGGEIAIPGMTLMFSLMLMGTVGIQFYREHGWHTWERMRLVARPYEIVIGKMIPAFLVLLTQATLVFIIGALVLGLNVSGSILAMILLLISFVFVGLALTMFFIAFCKTLDTLIVLSNLIAILLPGLGGGLAPINALPAWAQAIAPVSPVYWAMDGLRKVILNQGQFADVYVNILVLIGFAILLMVVSLLRFKVGEVKRADT